jgi:hypothetical protein
MLKAYPRPSLWPMAPSHHLPDWTSAKNAIMGDIIPRSLRLFPAP